MLSRENESRPQGGANDIMITCKQLMNNYDVMIYTWKKFDKQTLKTNEKQIIQKLKNFTHFY